MPWSWARILTKKLDLRDPQGTQLLLGRAEPAAEHDIVGLRDIIYESVSVSLTVHFDA